MYFYIKILSFQVNCDSQKIIFFNKEIDKTKKNKNKIDNERNRNEIYTLKAEEWRLNKTHYIKTV